MTDPTSRCDTCRNLKRLGDTWFTLFYPNGRRFCFCDGDCLLRHLEDKYEAFRAQLREQHLQLAESVAAQQRWGFPS